MISNGEEKIILPGSNAAQFAKNIHQLHALDATSGECDFELLLRFS